jgi:serine/threonine protein kinase
MSLTSGPGLGPYKIVGGIGVGGMGEVYRARDARLNRDPAPKFLPEAFARDAERMARFRREAQVLASLNHPNIAAIYGFENSGSTHALAMELIEGPTFVQGEPDLNGALWKVGWDGEGLARTSATIRILYNFNYNRTALTNQFDVSSDGHHLAFQTEQILEENIGMIENVR